jgi:hypothetical protein
VSDWIMLLETLLQWEVWLRQESIKTSELHRARKKHQYMMGWGTAYRGQSGRGSGLSDATFRGRGTAATGTAATGTAARRGRGYGLPISRSSRTRSNRGDKATGAVGGLPTNWKWDKKNSLIALSKSSLTWLIWLHQGTSRFGISSTRPCLLQQS